MDSPEQDKFEVPEHVIEELGASAGDISAASRLIDSQDQEEAEEPDENVAEISEGLRNNGEASITRAIEKWGRYSDHFVIKPTNLPRNLEELRQSHPNFEADFSKLCLAWSAIVEFGNTDEGEGDHGQNIGTQMEFVLLPWEVFREELAPTRGHSLRNTVVELRSTQAQDDMPALELDSTIMDNLENDNVRYFVGNGDQTIGVEQYVEGKIKQEGNWGLMLMQTSAQSGIKRWKGESPTETTLDKGRHLKLGQISVGHMGVLEVLALTLQEELPAMDRKIWLPANSFPDDEMPHPNNRWKTPPSRVQETMDSIIASSRRARQVRPAVSAQRI